MLDKKIPEVNKKIFPYDLVIAWWEDIVADSIWVDIPDIKIEQLKLALVGVLRRAEILSTHNILSETLSVRERMSSMLSKLKNHENIEFAKLFNLQEGRLGVIVTFLALLELVKESLIDVIQNEPMSRIYIGLKK